MMLQTRAFGGVLIVSLVACVVSGHAFYDQPAERTSGRDMYDRPAEKRSGMHLCGAALADALNMVCQYSMGKRSATAPLLKSLRPEFSSEQLSFSSLPFASYQQIRTARSSDVRTKRSGIVEECCLNPCSLSTLAKYCW